MRITARIAAAALLLAGCESIPPKGPLVQATPTRTAPKATPTTGGSTGTSTGSFDFEGEDRKDEEDAADGEEVDPIALQAKAMGVDPSELTPPEPAPKSAPAATAVAPVTPGMPTPVWHADQPIDGSFGLRVMATLHDVQPPRAVVATADGQELVVQPGQMLPQHRLVVLAIGHGAVQVAHVTPQGFYARVQTETIATLAPSETGR